MANIMSQVKLKNKVSRNGFDLSKRNIFSAKVGELLPVYCKEVLPGDKFKINVGSFTRTMPVNTAAYTRIKEYYDWFFVPTNLLWNKFNSWVIQQGDNVQHSLDINSRQTVGTYHPYFTLNAICDHLNQINESYKQAGGHPDVADNMFGFNRALCSAKLLDYLGYGDVTRNWDGVSGAYATNPVLNPFPLLAYQKIYSDYFRYTQWELTDPTTFNVDYVNAQNYEIPIDTLDWEYTETMFDLRYANWPKDLFTGVLPNSQFGYVASVDLSSLVNPTAISNNIELYSRNGNAGVPLQTSSYISGLSKVSAGGNTNFYLNADSVGKIATAIGLTPDKLRSAFSILALREAEAIQRLKEIQQSNRQDYKSQVEAIFNVSVADAYSETCHYIDGFSDIIDINEVVNTNINNGETENIADIAGKGVGRNEGFTQFSSDVHGYIMCIYHAVPLLDYSLETRIARQNLKSVVTDYAIPVLDKIGMVSVPMIEMTNDVELNKGQLIGYAPRYYDYKTDVDEIHGSARNRNSAWVAPFNDQYLKTLLFPRGDAGEELKEIGYTFFKVNPSILDPIFASQTNSDSTTDSDQLLTNCMFKVSAVRNLDYNGLPY